MEPVGDGDETMGEVGSCCLGGKCVVRSVMLQAIVSPLFTNSPSPLMKIVQINSLPEDSMGNIQVIGLSDDGQVYKWDWADSKWVFYGMKH